MPDLLVSGSIMAKARPQRTRAHRKKAYNYTQQARSRVSRRSNVRWGSWAIPLSIAALVLAGLVVWWVMASDSSDEGPGAAASVQPVATLNSADFHSLLVDPQDAEHLLFGSHAGIQESHDGGVSWEEGTLRNADAMQLSASPKAPETIYATGHDVFQVSQDGGQTWQAPTHDLPGTDIHGFAQDPDKPQRLFAFIAGGGVFTSADAGTTWDSLPTQPPGGGMHVALATSGGSLYAATDTGLVVSRDSGQSWEALPSQPSGQIISLAVPATDPQTLYAGTVSGLATSTDGAASWTNLGPEGVPILAIAVTPSDADRVFLLSDAGGIYRSDDGGITWH